MKPGTETFLTLSMKASRTSSGVHSMRPLSRPSSKSIILGPPKTGVLAMAAEISSAASLAICPPLSL